MVIDCVEERRMVQVLSAPPSRRASGAPGGHGSPAGAVRPASNSLGNVRRASDLTPEAANEVLRTKLAPWVQDLKLVVLECSPERTRLRMPYSRDVVRLGSTVCGQALMAAADTAMAIAIAAMFGAFRDATTVTQSVSFMRPIAESDVEIVATIRKLGRSLVFGDLALAAEGSPLLAAHATATWMLIN